MFFETPQMRTIWLYFFFMVFGMALFQTRFYPWISSIRQIWAAVVAWCLTGAEQNLSSSFWTHTAVITCLWTWFEPSPWFFATVLIFSKSSVICLVYSQKSLFLTLSMQFSGNWLINNLAKRVNTLSHLQHSPAKSYWPGGWGLPEAIRAFVFLDFGWYIQAHIIK